MRTILRHPLQLRILAAAHEPVSAAELARRLGLPRQRLNYHVRQLAEHGFLQPVAQQRKRNMVEHLYVAVAPAAATQSVSAEQLAALYARAQSELSLVVESAAAAGVRVRTLGLQRELHFSSAQERQEFTEALLEAIEEVIAEFGPDEKQPSTKALRLVLGCYPIVAETV